MVEFDFLAALVGGLVATVVMTAMMQVAARAGMTDMPPMPLVMGSIVSGDRKTATTVGGVLHVVMMGTVVFGLVYGSLFTAFDDDRWWVGVLIGVVHALIAGVVFMPMMPKMHPRMSLHPVGAGTPDDGRARRGRPRRGRDRRARRARQELGRHDPRRVRHGPRCLRARGGPVYGAVA